MWLFIGIVVKLLQQWHSWNAISSSVVWESFMSRCLSLDSPVFLQRVCWHWLFFQLCSHLYSLSLSVCPLSLAACSGPFIVCCLLYQFLLVPSGPRVFSLSASGIFWSWPVLRWGPARVCEEWCGRCCVEASGMRLKPQNTKIGCLVKTDEGRGEAHE